MERILLQTSINSPYDKKPHEFFNNRVWLSMNLEPPVNTEIFDIIMSLNQKKSCSPRGISRIFVRAAASVIAPILTQFFMFSFNDGVFPSCLKIAKVIPIHKSGSTKLTNNVRPISLLSVFSKIFEMLILKHFTNFLDKHKIIHSHQYGFRKHHSTEHALIDILSNCYCAIDLNRL